MLTVDNDPEETSRAFAAKRRTLVSVAEAFNVVVLELNLRGLWSKPIQSNEIVGGRLDPRKGDDNRGIALES